MDFQGDEDAVRALIGERFPLTVKKGIVKIERVRNLEGRVAM